MSERPSFYAELKRRRVTRVAGVYAAAAFVVWQAADIAFPALHLPGWVVTAVVVLSILGFPAAVALAWAFDVTADGVVRTGPAEAGSTADRVGVSRRSLRVHRLAAGGGALVLALAGGAFAVKNTALRSGASPGVERSAASAQAGEVVADRSVAVLPFVDLSESGDQKWFADGLAEEVLTSLSRLPELRVVGRNSSFLFATGAAADGVIADTLGVAHLVKGSVRRVGDRLRVTAQLVRAADGVQLWSESYDRAAADLLDVQRDVAEKVAGALDVMLDDERRQRMFTIGTRSVDAYEAFLRGRDMYIAAHEASGSLAEANMWFERALELDPRFGRAALLHADRYAHRVLWGPDLRRDPALEPISDTEAAERLRNSLDRAARNAPDAYQRVIAEINREFFAPTWHRLPALIEELRGVVSTGDASSDDNWAAHALLISGEFELARSRAERALRADPLDGSAWWNLAKIETCAGGYEAARSTIAEGLRTAGNYPMLGGLDLTIATLEGDYAAALNRSAVSGSGYSAALAFALRAERDSALQRAHRTALQRTRVAWPQARWLRVYHELGEAERVRELVRQMDALPTGPAILAVHVLETGCALTFDVGDTPAFAARLREAGVDPGSLRMLPRLSGGAEAAR
jgi:adenylate cyclase